MPTTAFYFFTYFTPIIFAIGVVGNIISLIVFLSKNMRKLSASMYLAALSTSDLLALLFYVLPEWLKHGFSLVPGHQQALFLQQNGTCQGLLYLQYIARFLCSWFVVFFTIERFIGVCFPLRRKDICDPKSASRVILGAIVVASSGCVFKPILSGTFIAKNGDPVCTSNRDHQYLSFILDSIFGVTITFIPFVLITILNLLIIRKLVLRNKRHRKIRIVTEESIIRLEFTFILLAISICFVSLNLPYFAVWCKRYWKIKQILYITRTIFYINYCINFFLYSVTGAYFRKELRHLFLNRGRNSYSYRYPRHYSAYLTRSSSQNTSKSSTL
ncbi:thyrotropin-releasing hormone receptor-like [Mya arenaria]|uniref:thyrotropin-releasing hormone receptor-like n=1 Tax=Mya arenaria TaxID=6604 RepID=UPI0022E0766A|nr:thyrotropin-releasing hormone receptor-like [Mya arenaria]